MSGDIDPLDIFESIGKALAEEAELYGVFFAFVCAPLPVQAQVPQPAPATEEVRTDVYVHKCAGCALDLPKVEFNGRIFHQFSTREFECTNYSAPGTVLLTKEKLEGKKPL